MIKQRPPHCPANSQPHQKPILMRLKLKLRRAGNCANGHDGRAGRHRPEGADGVVAALRHSRQRAAQRVGTRPAGPPGEDAAQHSNTPPAGKPWQRAAQRMGTPAAGAP
jgi:hypothetical protein